MNTTTNSNNQPKTNQAINGNESSLSTVLKGRLTAPVTVEETKNGKKFANFSIAFNTISKDVNGEKQPVTKFYNMTAWETVAEALANNASKGDFIKVRVAIAPHIYPSHKQETMKTEMKMTANRFKVVSRARANQ